MKFHKLSWMLLKHKRITRKLHWFLTVTIPANFRYYVYSNIMFLYVGVRIYSKDYIVNPEKKYDIVSRQLINYRVVYNMSTLFFTMYIPMALLVFLFTLFLYWTVS